MNLKDYQDYRAGAPPESLLTPAAKQELWVYGGTYSTIAFIPRYFKMGAPMGFLIFIDPALCLAIDTLILPLTICRQVSGPPERSLEEPDQDDDVSGSRPEDQQRQR